MSQYCFNLLLSKIEHDIKKQDTFWRPAITPKERLAVCLRYVYCIYSVQRENAPRAYQNWFVFAHSRAYPALCAPTRTAHRATARSGDRLYVCTCPTTTLWWQQFERFLLMHRTVVYYARSVLLCLLFSVFCNLSANYNNNYFFLSYDIIYY